MSSKSGKTIDMESSKTGIPAHLGSKVSGEVTGTLSSISGNGEGTFLSESGKSSKAENPQSLLRVGSSDREYDSVKAHRTMMKLYGRGVTPQQFRQWLNQADRKHSCAEDPMRHISSLCRLARLYKMGITPEAYQRWIDSKSHQIQEQGIYSSQTNVMRQLGPDLTPDYRSCEAIMKELHLCGVVPDHYQRWLHDPFRKEAFVIESANKTKIIILLSKLLNAGVTPQDYDRWICDSNELLMSKVREPSTPTSPRIRPTPSPLLIPSTPSTSPIQYAPSPSPIQYAPFPSPIQYAPSPSSIPPTPCSSPNPPTLSGSSTPSTPNYVTTSSKQGTKDSRIYGERGPVYAEERFQQNEPCWHQHVPGGNLYPGLVGINGGDRPKFLCIQIQHHDYATYANVMNQLSNVGDIRDTNCNNNERDSFSKYLFDDAKEKMHLLRRYERSKNCATQLECGGRDSIANFDGQIDEIHGNVGVYEQINTHSVFIASIEEARMINIPTLLENNLDLVGTTNANVERNDKLELYEEVFSSTPEKAVSTKAKKFEEVGLSTCSEKTKPHMVIRMMESSIQEDHEIFHMKELRWRTDKKMAYPDAPSSKKQRTHTRNINNCTRGNLPESQTNISSYVIYDENAMVERNGNESMLPQIYPSHSTKSRHSRSKSLPDPMRVRKVISDFLRKHHSKESKDEVKKSDRKRRPLSWSRRKSKDKLKQNLLTSEPTLTTGSFKIGTNEKNRAKSKQSGDSYQNCATGAIDDQDTEDIVISDKLKNNIDQKAKLSDEAPKQSKETNAACSIQRGTPDQLNENPDCRRLTPQSERKHSRQSIADRSDDKMKSTSPISNISHRAITPEDNSKKRNDTFDIQPFVESSCQGENVQSSFRHKMGNQKFIANHDDEHDKASHLSNTDKRSECHEVSSIIPTNKKISSGIISERLIADQDTSDIKIPLNYVDHKPAANSAEQCTTEFKLSGGQFLRDYITSKIRIHPNNSFDTLTKHKRCKSGDGSCLDECRDPSKPFSRSYNSLTIQKHQNDGKTDEVHLSCMHNEDGKIQMQNILVSQQRNTESGERISSKEKNIENTLKYSDSGPTKMNNKYEMHNNIIIEQTDSKQWQTNASQTIKPTDYVEREPTTDTNKNMIVSDDGFEASPDSREDFDSGINHRNEDDYDNRNNVISKTNSNGCCGCFKKKKKTKALIAKPASDQYDKNDRRGSFLSDDFRGLREQPWSSKDSTYADSTQTEENEKNIRSTQTEENEKNIRSSIGKDGDSLTFLTSDMKTRSSDDVKKDNPTSNAGEPPQSASSSSPQASVQISSPHVSVKISTPQAIEISSPKTPSRASSPKSHSSSPKPHSSSPKPYTSSPKPHTSSPKPHTSSPKPHTSSPKPSQTPPRKPGTSPPQPPAYGSSQTSYANKPFPVATEERNLNFYASSRSTNPGRSRASEDVVNHSGNLITLSFERDKEYDFQCSLYGKIRFLCGNEENDPNHTTFGGHQCEMVLQGDACITSEDVYHGTTTSSYRHTGPQSSRPESAASSYGSRHTPSQKHTSSQRHTPSPRLTSYHGHKELESVPSCQISSTRPVTSSSESVQYALQSNDPPSFGYSSERKVWNDDRQQPGVHVIPLESPPPVFLPRPQGYLSTSDEMSPGQRSEMHVYPLDSPLRSHHDKSDSTCPSLASERTTSKIRADSRPAYESPGTQNRENFAVKAIQRMGMEADMPSTPGAVSVYIQDVQQKRPVYLKRFCGQPDLALGIRFHSTSRDYKILDSCSDGRTIIDVLDRNSEPYFSAAIEPEATSPVSEIRKRKYFTGNNDLLSDEHTIERVSNISRRGNVEGYCINPNTMSHCYQMTARSHQTTTSSVSPRSR